MLTDVTLLLPELSLQYVGLTGAAIYMTNYSLLATRILSGDSIFYFMMNLLASALVLLSLSQSFNAASVVIQLFWFVISIVSILVRLRRNRAPAPEANRLRRLT